MEQPMDIFTWTRLETIGHLTFSKLILQTMRISNLFRWGATALSVLYSLTALPLLGADSIGDISELRGNAQIVRGEATKAELGFAIETNDEAITTNGRMALQFMDESIVRLTEDSKLIIDKYIYDPDPSKAKMALTFAVGTTRFLSGNVDRMSKQNVTLKTPSANIFIRGSSFTTTIDEFGRSLIVNVPYGPNDSMIGEIEVQSAMGSVILNEPFQATTVATFESIPTTPVILDLTLDLIDNMLIVNPPREDVAQQEEQTTQTADYLDFNELDIDYLNEDFLDNEADLEFTELDINYLDVNFLEDLLDVLDALEIAEDEDALAQEGNISIVGTSFGQDTDTQITTFLTGQVLTLQRNVAGNARVDIDGAGSYTVIFIQDGVSRTITINGGSSTQITIKQSG